MPDRPDTSATPARSTRLATLLPWLLLLALLAANLRAAASGTYVYSMFGDRDLVRGLELWSLPQTSGAELANGSGARVPGALLGVLFGLPLWLGGDAHAVFLLQATLEAIAIAWVAATVSRRFGAWPALAAAAVMLAATSEQENVQGPWNPGVLPLFVAGAWAGFDRAWFEGRTSGLVACAVWSALGAQLHLSMLLVTAPMLLALVIRGGPARAWRAWTLTLLGVVLAYAPFLWTEARDGLPSFHLLGEQDMLREGSQPLGATLARTITFLGLLVEPSTHDPTSHAVAQAGSVVLGMLLAYALTAAGARCWTAWRQGHAVDARDTLLFADVGILLTGVAYLASDETLATRSRYLLAFVPSLARLVTHALVAGRTSLAARPPAVRAVGLGLLAAVVLATTWQREPRFPIEGGDALRHEDRLRAQIDELRRAHGWTLRDVVGRTAWFELRGESFAPAHGPTVDLWLAREGTAFPGSLPPPCVLVQFARSVDELDPRTLLTELQPDGFRVDSVVETSDHVWTTIYTPTVGRCSTTMSQRYHPTPMETRLRAHATSLPCDTARDISTPDDAGPVWAVRYDFVDDPRRCRGQFVLAVALSKRADGVTATLHGNQLRGLAPNQGWYRAALIARPTLTFTRSLDATTVVVPLADGRVGSLWENTPLTVAAPLTPGTWAVRLHAELVAEEPRFPLAADLPTLAPLDVELSAGWTVP